MSSDDARLQAIRQQAMAVRSRVFELDKVFELDNVLCLQIGDTINDLLEVLHAAEARAASLDIPDVVKRAWKSEIVRAAAAEQRAASAEARLRAVQDELDALKKENA